MPTRKKTKPADSADATTPEEIGTAPEPAAEAIATLTSSTLNPQPSTLNPRPSTLKPSGITGGTHDEHNAGKLSKVGI
jgi:hypothetical protein